MSAVTSQDQAVLNAENALFGLSITTIQTGQKFCNTSEQVSEELNEKAANYLNEIKASTYVLNHLGGGSTFSGFGIISLLLLLAPLVGMGVTCAFPENELAMTIAKNMGGAVNGLSMFSAVVPPAVQAHYEIKEANDQYGITLDTSAMKQTSNAGTVFAEGAQALTQTTGTLASALAAEIAAKAAGRNSTLKYGA